MQRWEELAYAREDGIAEGIEKGIEKGRAEEIVETGLECGLSEQSILERLQSRLNVSLERAQEYFDMQVSSDKLVSKQRE